MGIADRLPKGDNYITISCKLNQIAVKKACLLSIGSPEYIFFLMNYDGKSAIIKPALGNEEDAIRITSSCYTRSSIFYFGSKVLIGSIAAAMKWERDRTYRIAGNLIENNMLFFDFRTGIESTNPVDATEEDDTSYFWKDTGEEAIIQSKGHFEKKSIQQNAQAFKMMPKLDTLIKILHKLGLTLTITPLQESNATLEDALRKRYAVSDKSNDEECEHIISGEFDDLILADLIREGYDGDALLSEFRARRARVRPAVKKLLKQAEDAAKGIGKYSTLEEMFGESPSNSE